MRAVPVDTRRGAGVANGGLRMQLSWGSSTQNVDPSPAAGLGGGVRLGERTGTAMRFTWWGPQRAGQPGNAWTDVFRGGFSPLLDVTLAYDHERTDPRIAPGRPDPVSIAPWKVEHYGCGATLSRVLTGRFGYIDDRDGEIRKPTWGAGVCLPLRHAGELRYDFASWPQAYDRRVSRHELSLRIDSMPRRGAHRESSED